MKHKNYISVFIFLIFLFTTCVQKKQNTKIDYCERLHADQSNLSRSHMSKIEKEERFKKRQAAFKKNWEIFTGLIKSDDLSIVNKDTCYKEFLLVTLIHNVQNFPKEIFNKSMIDKIKKEIDNGNIAVDYLRTSLSTYKNYTHEEKRCKKMKDMVDYAISTWRINENYEQSIHGKIGDIEYIDCKKK